MTFKSFSKLLINCIIANHPHHKTTQINRICVGRSIAKIFLLHLEKQTRKLSSQCYLSTLGKQPKCVTILNTWVYNILIHPESQKNWNLSSFNVQVTFLLAVGLCRFSFQMLPV